MCSVPARGVGLTPAASCSLMFVSEGMSLSDWRFRTSLYFAKMVIGLLSLPFLVFRLPFIK